MAESFESGALLGHVYTLSDGLLVRLRLARSSDAPAVKRLLEGEGYRLLYGEGNAGSDLETARLVHFDPRRRYVVCATGLVDNAETLLGLGAIPLQDGAELDLLVVADGHPQEIAALLRRALKACAESRARAA